MAGPQQALQALQRSADKTLQHARCSLPAWLQVGIALVGTSSLLSGEGSSTHPVTPQQMLAGMALIVASQVPALHPCRPSECARMCCCTPPVSYLYSCLASQQQQQQQQLVNKTATQAAVAQCWTGAAGGAGGAAHV